MTQGNFVLLISPDVEKFLSENDISITSLLDKTKLKYKLTTGENPVGSNSGRKDPATIILASAAAVAAATPLLRELLRTLSGRAPIVKERRLSQVKDEHGVGLLDKDGAPVMEWSEIEKKDIVGDKFATKALGIDISFESK